MYFRDWNSYFIWCKLVFSQYFLTQLNLTQLSHPPPHPTPLKKVVQKLSCRWVVRSWVRTFPAREVGVWNWMLKNAIFENNGRRLNQMRYSSMNDWIAPGMWSPFVPTIIPSYHTSHRYWWKIIIIMVCFYSTPPPPQKKKNIGGGVMKHTPPLKIFNIFDW